MAERRGGNDERGALVSAEEDGRESAAESLLCVFSAEAAEMLLLSIKIRSCAGRVADGEAEPTLAMCSKVTHLRLRLSLAAKVDL
jgi:hypothetical protein